MSGHGALHLRRCDVACLTVYAAGFFDGEGSVTITRNAQKSTGREYHVLRVSTAQVMREPLDLMHEQWGGIVLPKKLSKEEWTPSFVWQLSDVKAETFLRDIQPHCIVKAEDIRLALEFRALRCKRGSKAGEKRGTPRQQDVHDAREVLRMKLNERVKLADMKVVCPDMGLFISDAVTSPV